MIAAFSAICMTVSLLPCYAAAAASEPVFLLRGDKTSAAPGELVTYTVSLRDAESTAGFGAKIEFDSSILTYIGSSACMDYSYITRNDVYAPTSGTSSTVQALVQFNGNYAVTSADIFTATFAVKDGAESGNYGDAVKLTKAQISLDYGSAVMTDCMAAAQNDGDLYINPTPAPAFGMIAAADKDTVKCGEEVNYTFTMNDEAPVQGYDIGIRYNTDLLEYIDADENDNINEQSEGYIRTMAMFGSDNTVTGELFTLKFRAKRIGRTELDVETEYLTSAGVMGSFGVTNNTETVIDGVSVMTISADPAEAAAGETVRVSVSVCDAASLAGIRFDLRYDNTKLKLKDEPVWNEGDKSVEIPTNTGIGNASINEEGVISYIYMGSALDGDVELISIDFTVTGAGGSDIRLSETESDPDGVVDFSAAANILTFDPPTDAEIENVKALIEAVPATDEINEENYCSEETIAAVEAARAAYDALTDAKKNTVDSAKLDEAETKIADLKAAADKAAAEAVIGAIDAIEPTAENTDEAQAAADAARAAYEALTDEQKALVSEEDLAKLDAAQAAIDALVKAAEDKTAADAVAEMLNALEVTKENYLEAPDSILAVQIAYNLLSDDQKALVEDYDEKIAAAQTAYEELVGKAAADKAATDSAVKAIGSIGDVTIDNYESKAASIALARALYDDLTDDQKTLLGADELAKLEACEKAYADYAAMKDIKVTVTKNALGYILNAVEQKPIAAHQTVILAVYNADGSLAAAAFTTSDSGEAALGAGAGQTCKAFVWNSADNMKPYNSVEWTE